MPQEKINSNNTEKPKNAYFLSLELENVRCFSENQKIDFSDGSENPKQWTIILGDNGTGKTTILQSLIAVSPTILKNGIHTKAIKPEYPNPVIWKTWSPVRDFKSKFKIKGLFSNRAKIQRRVFGKYSKETYQCFGLEMFSTQNDPMMWNSLHPNNATNSLCLGYGASRKVGLTSFSEQESTKYSTLFSESALLVNPEEWLLQADYFVSRNSARKSKEKFRRVKNILIKVLPDIEDIRFTEKNIDERLFPVPIVEFQTPYGWVEAKDLSLGYRTSMAWMVDFASRMFDLYPESENPLAEPAIVLIDEIDLHLHPKWQRDLLPWLSELFPNTQFIVTTHSPLIVQSAVARDANIVVCRREGDHVVIDQSIEAVKNWRADQILTSDLFGLETARPKETGNLLKEKQKILSKAKLTKKDEKRLAELDQEIGFLPVSENSEDDEAMEIIRKAADWIKTQAK